MEGRSKLVNLVDSPIIDDHCHGFRAKELLALDPDGWEARMAMTGVPFASAGRNNPQVVRQVAAVRDGTVFALAARRWLAEYFGVPATPQAIAVARHAAFTADPAGYVRRLLADQNIEVVIADDGFPQPFISREEFEQSLGTTPTEGTKVYRMARIEPIIAEMQEASMSWADFEEGFEHALDVAATDSHTLGFKSIIAYRTGLDVSDPSPEETAVAYDYWRAAGWPKDRSYGKTVRDYCVRAALRACKRHDRVMHLHVGGGDPDAPLARVHPYDIVDLLLDHQDQPIVLIHGGFPWLAETAYIASVMPYVYVELSQFLGWASLGLDRDLEMLLGVVPTAKILYGSDEATEPENFWVTARMAREALERVLSRAADRGFLSPEQATDVGRGVLAENARRLYGLGN